MSHPADSVLLAPPNIRLFQCLFAGLLFCLLHKSLAFFFVLYPGPFPRQMALKSRQIVIQLRLFCLKAKPESIPIFSLLSPSFPINIAQTLFKPMLFKLWKQEREQNGECLSTCTSISTSNSTSTCISTSISTFTSMTWRCIFLWSCYDNI